MSFPVAILLVVYTLVLAGVAALRMRRSLSSGDEYLMAGREAPPYQVAAALFTLIGGGELVTMVALGYSFGSGGVALFLGYALAFGFVGVMAGRVREDYAERQYFSLPDYFYAKYGEAVGRLAFLVSFVAFFALLLLQFTAGGQLLSPLLGVSYTVAVLATAFIALIYLFIGGFRSVLMTDVLQGGVMIVLMPILIYVAANAGGDAVAPETEGGQLPVFLWLSLTLTGFFVGSSSADVWQRAYATRTDREARIGFIIGALILLFFGGLLIWLGIEARSIPAVSGPDAALVEIVQEVLPGPLAYAAIVLILSAIISTADTEIFLLSGLAVREQLRLKGYEAGAIKSKETVRGTRVWMGLIAIAAVGSGLIFSGLIEIYTWLLSALMILAPSILFALFGWNHKIASLSSILIGISAFIVLALIGQLTLDNSYLIVLIAGLVYILVGYVIPTVWTKK